MWICTFRTPLCDLLLWHRDTHNNLKVYSAKRETKTHRTAANVDYTRLHGQHSSLSGSLTHALSLFSSLPVSRRSHTLIVPMCFGLFHFCYITVVTARTIYRHWFEYLSLTNAVFMYIWISRIFTATSYGCAILIVHTQINKKIFYFVLSESQFFISSINCFITAYCFVYFEQFFDYFVLFNRLCVSFTFQLRNLFVYSFF